MKEWILRAVWVLIGLVLVIFTVLNFIPKRKAPKPYESITDKKLDVVVLNGTNRDKLAYAVSKYLISKGIDVIYYGNADSTYATTLIIDRRDSVGYSYARKVAKYIKGKILYMPDPDGIASVFIILGKDYK